jgi:hypothetical protein
MSSSSGATSLRDIIAYPSTKIFSPISQKNFFVKKTGKPQSILSMAYSAFEVN